jgi:hypothetical protein
MPRRLGRLVPTSMTWRPSSLPRMTRFHGCRGGAGRFLGIKVNPSCQRRCVALSLGLIARRAPVWSSRPQPEPNSPPAASFARFSPSPLPPCASAPLPPCRHPAPLVPLVFASLLAFSSLHSAFQIRLSRFLGSQFPLPAACCSLPAVFCLLPPCRHSAPVARLPAHGSGLSALHLIPLDATHRRRYVRSGVAVRRM